MESLTELTRPAHDAFQNLARTGEARVRFSNHPSVFQVRASTCDNPNCAGEALHVSFAEEIPGEEEAGLGFSITISLIDGEEMGASAERPDPVAGMIQEFIREFPSEILASIRKTLRLEKRGHFDALNLPAEWIREGRLLPFSHLLAGGALDDKGYRGVLDRFEVGATTWIVQDLYCPRPTYPSKEVHLDFIALPPKETPSTEDLTCFDACVALKTGRVVYEDLVGCPTKRAAAVYAHWLASTSVTRATLQARYHLVKAKAAAALQAAAHNPLPGGSPATRSARALPLRQRQALQELLRKGGTGACGRRIAF